MALSKEERDALPDDRFAVPDTRDLPIHDERHVRMAWSQVDRTGGLSAKQRAEARRRIMRRAKDLGMDTADWQVRAVAYQLSAMSLNVPEVADHPNRMHFSGILTRIDEASDNPPNGSNGKRVFIPKDVAEQALPTLLGMAVDFKPDLDGHDNQAKIGIITEAEIQGNAIHIAGFLYASDFPEECARIKAEKTQLGFSYECQAAIADLNADPWVVTFVIFTGAAVLKKHLAAYTTTSLAAQAEGNTDMDPKELKALTDSISALAASVATVSADVATLKKQPVQASAEVHAMVKPHADKLRACAAAMEASGIGADPNRGHVKVLKHMADRLEAEAMLGHVPHVYRDNDYLSAGADPARAQQDAQTTAKLETLSASMTKITDGLSAVTTMVTDLKAKAFTQVDAPQRRTMSAEIVTLLAKAGIKDDEVGKVTVQKVDQMLEAAGIVGRDAIEAKLKMRHAGVLQTAA